MTRQEAWDDMAREAATFEPQIIGGWNKASLNRARNLVCMRMAEFIEDAPNGIPANDLYAITAARTRLSTIQKQRWDDLSIHVLCQVLRYLQTDHVWFSKMALEEIEARVNEIEARVNEIDGEIDDLEDERSELTDERDRLRRALSGKAA